MQVDLNADVGEGCGSDEALMGLVSSANIACGWHAGDASTMLQTVRWALSHGVATLAQSGRLTPAAGVVPEHILRDGVGALIRAAVEDKG